MCPGARGGMRIILICIPDANNSHSGCEMRTIRIQEREYECE